METIIEDLNLTEKEVLRIVLQWYVGGMYSGILQDEEGQDLEEILNNEIEILK